MAEKKQKTVEDEWEKKKAAALPVFFLQVGLGLSLSAGILAGGYYLVPSIPVPKSNDFSVKLQYTLRCCGFPQVVLLIFAIWRVMRKRGSTPAGNPLSGQDHKYLQAEKNALTNTVEQLLCFFLVVLVLITYLEPSEMRIVPLFSACFIVGRLLFLIGYSINPLYRVAGIFVTFVPIVCFTAYIIYLMYSRGLMYNIPFTAPAGNSARKTEL